MVLTQSVAERRMKKTLCRRDLFLLLSLLLICGLEQAFSDLLPSVSTTEPGSVCENIRKRATLLHAPTSLPEFKILNDNWISFIDTYVNHSYDLSRQEQWNYMLEQYRPGSISVSPAASAADTNIFKEYSVVDKKTLFISDCEFGLQSLVESASFTSNEDVEVKVLVLKQCNQMMPSYDNMYAFIDTLVSAVRLVRGDRDGPIVALQHFLPDIKPALDFELFYLYHYLLIEYVALGECAVLLPPALAAESAKTTAIFPSLQQLLSSAVLNIQGKSKNERRLQSAPYFLHGSAMSDENTVLQEVSQYINTLLLQFSNRPEHRINAMCYRYISSRKYDACCMPEIVYKKVGLYSLLVTGTGGSGTHNIAKVLGDAGFKVAHESIATDGSVVSILLSYMDLI
jgi:hypothetical protein